MYNRRLHIPSLLFIFSLLLSDFANAQQTIIPLYTQAAPGSENWNWQEKETDINPMKFRIVYNVTKPSLTVFSPDDSTANESAIIIFPGGGFRVLNIDHEGTNIAKQLTKKGFTVFVLRYRVGQSLTENPWEEMTINMKDKDKYYKDNETIKQLALDDAVKAIQYVRKESASFKIKPGRIGMIGFSAGGFLARTLAVHVDAAIRPDFVAVIYAGVHTSEKVIVPQKTPPLFIAGATDDVLSPASSVISLYNLWLESKQSAELHLYAKGGHGLRFYSGNSWMGRYFDWLVLQGLMK